MLCLVSELLVGVCSSGTLGLYSDGDQARNLSRDYEQVLKKYCHSQAKLNLKAKLGWLDYQLEATTATAAAVLFEPGAFKPGALKPGASKSARDVKFSM